MALAEFVLAECSCLFVCVIDKDLSTWETLCISRRLRGRLVQTVAATGRHLPQLFCNEQSQTVNGQVLSTALSVDRQTGDLQPTVNATCHLNTAITRILYVFHRTPIITAPPPLIYQPGSSTLYSYIHCWNYRNVNGAVKYGQQSSYLSARHQSPCA